jgi:hypothetical protein
MSEQKNPIPHAADQSALSDESLESVAGGRNRVTSPAILIIEPAVEPIRVDLEVPIAGV